MCSHAPAQLSSEPQLFPIEPEVLPLVYGLTVLRVIETCWSCQGHRDDKGGLQKIPQIWFYSPSGTYAELIARHMTKLRADKRLFYPWQVVVDPFDAGGPATTFILKPDLADGVDISSLDRLQQDLRRIAEFLPERVRHLADEEIAGHRQRRAA